MRWGTYTPGRTIWVVRCCCCQPVASRWPAVAARYGRYGATANEECALHGKQRNHAAAHGAQRRRCHGAIRLALSAFIHAFSASEYRISTYGDVLPVLFTVLLSGYSCFAACRLYLCLPRTQWFSFEPRQASKSTEAEVNDDARA